MSYLLGELPEEKVTEIRDWIAADPENAAYFNQFKTIWDQSKQLAAVSVADENKAWEKFRARVNETAPVPATTRPLYRKWYRSMAAAAVLLIAFGLFWWNNKAVSTEEIISGMAVQQTALPDGSAVTLNKQSTLQYPSSFRSGKRNVKLRGEAFFNITPDKTKPFEIDVQDIAITVLGTSFNVKESKTDVEVVVETGVVNVSRGGTVIQLNAGEKIRMPFAGTVPAKEQSTDKLYKYYRTRSFVCDDTPLWKLVQVLNEAYQVQIGFGRPELRDLRMNTTFNDESLDQVLDVIRLTFSISIRKEAGRIILE